MISCSRSPLFFPSSAPPSPPPSFPTRRSSDLGSARPGLPESRRGSLTAPNLSDLYHPKRRTVPVRSVPSPDTHPRSEEHTSELQSPCNLVCRLLLEKKNRLSK